MTENDRSKQQKAERIAAIGARGKVEQKIDLSSPKERAVVDVLALAMAADGEVAVEETALVVEQLEKMLGLEEGGPEFAGQIRAHVAATVAELEKIGRDPILGRSVGTLETAQERETLFALATAVTCVDGVVEPTEADYLVALRTALGLTEADALAGVAGVAGTLAAMTRKR